MRDSILITCPDHECPLMPSPVVPHGLLCPEAGCKMAVKITAAGTDDFAPDPLTYLEQGAAQRHELVRAHEAVGFSRSEAMQVMIAVITATIMKDRGDT